jgi:eukaryotic-like serine/threonine-protein kinase
VAIGSCAGTLYLLKRDTGEPLWSYDARGDGAEPQFHGEPRVLGDALIIPTDAEKNGYVYSFDARTGDLRWKVPFKGGVAATPLLVGKQLVVVAVEGTVAAIDPSSGDVAWRVSPSGATTSPPWVPSPAAADGRIFVADNTGKVFALDAATGKRIWRKELSSRVNTSMLVIGKTVVAGTSDGYLVRLASDTGEIATRLKLPGLPYGTLISSPPLLLMLVKGDAANLIAFDTGADKIRWQQRTPKEWTTYRPLVVGATVLVGSEDKELCAFDLSDGGERWCRAVAGVPRGLGISSDRILYVGTLGGRVSAYRFDDDAKPKK